MLACKIASLIAAIRVNILVKGKKGLIFGMAMYSLLALELTPDQKFQRKVHAQFNVDKRKVHMPTIFAPFIPEKS